MINIEDLVKEYQKAEKEAYKKGQDYMLEKVMELVKQWQKGLYSDSEFLKVLNDYYKEYGTQPMGDKTNT